MGSKIKIKGKTKIKTNKKFVTCLWISVNIVQFRDMF